MMALPECHSYFLPSWEALCELPDDPVVWPDEDVVEPLLLPLDL